MPVIDDDVLLSQSLLICLLLTDWVLS